MSEHVIRNCIIGNHEFEVLSRHGSELAENVIRWCTKCGSVRFDVDYDNRTNTGTLRAPELAKVVAENSH